MNAVRSHQLITASTLFFFLSVYLSVSGISFFSSLLFLLVGVFLWRPLLEMRKHPLFWPTIVFTAAILLSVVCSPDYPFWKPLGKLRYYWFVFFLATIVASDTQRLEKLSVVIVPLSLFLGVVSIGQSLFGIKPPFVGDKFLWPVLQSTGELYHARGFFWHHTPFGFALVNLHHIYFGQFLNKSECRTKPLFWVGWVATLISVLLTFSRSAWLGLLVSSVLLVLITSRKYFLKIAVPMVVVFLIVFSASGAFRRRFLDINPNKNSERFELWSICYQMFQEAPILGKGFHSFEAKQRKYMNEEQVKRPLPNDPHSSYMAILAGTGVIGMACYLFWLGSVVFLYLRAFRQDRIRGPTRAWLFTAFGAFLAFLLSSSFDSLHFHTNPLSVMVTYLGIGMGLVWSKRTA